MSATEDLADSSCALRDDARELIYGVQPLLTLAIVHGREAEEADIRYSSGQDRQRDVGMAGLPSEAEGR